MASLDLDQFFDADVVELEVPHSEGLTWFALNDDNEIVIVVGCTHEAESYMEGQGLNPLFLAQLTDEEIESLL